MVATGVLNGDLARQFGAGGVVGRASGRDFDARRDFSYPPYDQLSFKVAVRREGDVNARVWVRINEVGESLNMIDAILARLPEGPIRAELPPAAGPGEGLALIEAFRGDVLRTCASTATAGSPAVTCATLRGSSGRCSKRRSKAISSPTFRCAISRSTARIRDATSRMRNTLLQGVLRPPLTDVRPPSDDPELLALAASVKLAAERTPRPQSRHSACRRRLVQRLRTRDPRARQRLLRSRAIRLPLCRFAAARRHAAGDRAGHDATCARL